MVKYIPEQVSVVMEEIPNMVSLSVSITNCSGICEGCHSPFLREDIGEELTKSVIDKLIYENFGINNFLFLGEGRDAISLCQLAEYIKSNYGIKVSLYSGRVEVEQEFYYIFDYIKVGPYISSLGPLNKKTTNQRLYEIKKNANDVVIKDITDLFWCKK